MKSLHQTSAPLAPNVSRNHEKAPDLSLALSARMRGIQSRVAKRLCVSRTAVSRVAAGKMTSSRISAALDSEVARVRDGLSAPRKPFIRLRYFITMPTGDIKASGNLPFCGLATIGRPKI